MKNTILKLLSPFCFAPISDAAITIGHVEGSGPGSFLSSGGLGLTSGGVSIGYFVSAPADSAFGLSIQSWTDLLSAGFIDVRTLPAVDTTGLDWDFAGIAGSVSNVPFSGSTTTSTAIAQNTQLYVVAFNAGTFNMASPANSFVGATDWAVIKDNADLSPADLGTRNVVLSTAVGPTEILRGTDNGVNVNLVSVPEPSSIGLLAAGALAVGAFRRRSRV